MTTRWGLARRLAVVIALAVAVVGRPTGAEGASGDAAVPSVPGPCLVDRPCLLSAGLPGAAVLNPRLAPDGNRVVFVHEEAGSSDLYSVAITGTPSPRKLDAPAANVGIKNVFISPDSSRVIYTAQAEPGGPRTLYSVPITGSPSDNVRLASNVGGVPRISPNGRIVVVAFDTMDRLRAVPIEGPANAGGRLTDPFVAGGAIVEFKIANDGSVVYLADQDTNGVEELYRVPLTLAPAPDPPTTKLNGPLAPGGEVSAFSLELNNTPVAYLADQDTNDVTELYSVRLGGGGRTKLNQPLPAGWDVRSVLVDEAGWIPDDGTRIVYETGGPSGDQLHSALLAGPATTSVRLDQPPAPGTRVFSFRVSADGGRVVYTLRGATGGGEPLYFLFSVPTAGPASASVLLNWPSAEYGFGVISPDGSRVVNRLRGALDNSAIEGGTIVRINGSEPPDWPFLIDATSTRAFYLSRNGTEADLYSAPMSGSGARYNLTQTLDAEVDYRHVELTSGPSQRLVFVAHRSDGDHLYWSRLVPGIVPPPLP